MNISDLYILLVEPSTVQSKFIIQHLEEAGVGSIQGVSTGQEALDAIAKDVPDLVISSSAQRTRETFARMSLPVPVVFTERLYLASTDIILQSYQDREQLSFAVASTGIEHLSVWMALHH